MDIYSRPVRIALDILGLLVALCGIALTFSHEAYVVGVLLVAIVVSLAIALIKHIRAKDFRYHTLHHYVELMDPSGSSSIWRKETLATPLERNIRIWQDHLFHASGALHFESTNIGRLLSPEQQGGEPSVTTVFDSPLEVGKRIHKVLTIRCEDCFPNEKESISWIPMRRFEEMGFHVTLPQERPCKGQPKTLCYTGTSSEELNGTEVSEHGTRLDVVITRPKPAGKYVLFWEW